MYHRDDGCVGILRHDSKVNMCPPLKEDDEEAVRRCVATGFRILDVSLLDREQRIS